MDSELLKEKFKLSELVAHIMVHNGKIIKETIMEYIIKRMAIATKANGVMIVKFKTENFLIQVLRIFLNLQMRELMESPLNFLKTS